MEKKNHLKKGMIGLLAGLTVLHTVEWFTVGKNVAKDANVPRSEAMAKCLLMGILWWGPMKKRSARSTREGS